MTPKLARGDSDDSPGGVPKKPLGKASKNPPKNPPKSPQKQPPANSINSSEFIRLLAGLSAEPALGSLVAERSSPSFAEKLGLWVGWADAISFSAVLGASPAGPPDYRAAAPPTPLGWAREPVDGAADEVADAVADAVARIRRELARSITADTLLAPAKPVRKPAAPHADAVMAPLPDFPPYRRCYAAHQRAMEARIATLRGEVRSAVASRSAAGARLAALDAVWDTALKEREGHLLSTVPALLEKRFKNLRRTHQPASAGDTTETASKSDAPVAANWITSFCSEMQTVLLAELDIRMLPVEGLMEALKN